MIRHIVMFSVANDANRDAVQHGLELLAQVPGPSRFAVCPNQKSDLFSKEIDFVVYAEFPDEAALEAYRAHPIYAESIAKVKPLRDLRIAADFILPL